VRPPVNNQRTNIISSADEGSAGLRQLSPEEVIQIVEDGLFSPEQAEKWAEDHKYPPFAPGPVDSPAGSETDHQSWTLPMAAAWFTWRSRRAVHHQSKSARIGWKRWVVVELASVPFARPKCRPEDFGEPTTWDVFREAIQDPRIPFLQRVVRPRPAPSLSDLKIDPPYGRLKKGAAIWDFDGNSRDEGTARPRFAGVLASKLRCARERAIEGNALGFEV
jgi:hypothetical protein